MSRGYSLDPAAVRERSDLHAVETGEKTKVQQQFRNECDVNTIVRRFGMTGTMPQSAREAHYGDFTGITDLESAIARVDEARARFMELPAEVRDAHGNDLVTFWRACQAMDDAELEQLGKPAASQLEVEKSQPAEKPAEVKEGTA